MDYWAHSNFNQPSKNRDSADDIVTKYQHSSRDLGELQRHEPKMIDNNDTQKRGQLLKISLPVSSVTTF